MVRSVCLTHCAGGTRHIYRHLAACPVAPSLRLWHPSRGSVMKGNPALTPPAVPGYPPPPIDKGVFFSGRFEHGATVCFRAHRAWKSNTVPAPGRPRLVAAGVGGPLPQEPGGGRDGGGGCLLGGLYYATAPRLYSAKAQMLVTQTAAIASTRRSPTRNRSGRTPCPPSRT